MERDPDSLMSLYVAGLCGIAYGLRQIIETQDKVGAQVDRIVISGGAGQSDIVRQILADGTGRPVLASDAAEPVLLGSAILGAVAAAQFPDMSHAMAAMSRSGAEYQPNKEASRLHDMRFATFCALQSALREGRDA